MTSISFIYFFLHKKTVHFYEKHGTVRKKGGRRDIKQVPGSLKKPVQRYRYLYWMHQLTTRHLDISTDGRFEKKPT
jgi:hypothetical protein